MQFLLYIFLYPILFLISILPFRLLYIFSDCVYILVYRIIGYRKKTVRENLALALPHLTEKERLVIEKKSYKHLCDMFLEMIKTMTISVKEIEKRFVLKNVDYYLEMEKQGKSIALMCGHYASYEWSISINSRITFEGFAIYKRINNKYFDDLVKKIRSRFKAYLITTKETVPTIEANNEKGVKGLYGFASDQSPQVKQKTYWSNFMGIEVPVYTGAEMLAKKFDMNVMFMKIKKVKRGFYEMEFELLTDDAKSIPNYQITETFLRKVEQQILEAPEFYLWTHKRWKHRNRKPV
ncbi:MAG: lysophospholipid acyltransferase family protein [Flavobacterium sp.]|jgi:Kdo2-lipid IVA lauroyltransferase/acyltransferase|uniref:lysophospholipid acyltransferase family protein n=1 Tax=Flavobacterium TaxID=237 RepID=UPI000DB80F74|nr:lysophospholipid acyltransferase family protein [Flavobacterium sp.]MCZ8091747.1 lysophospholipid acyltransferase family protein [Flavobacterium sp.]MCZ8331411.1 lysophospholipid acyltransferase family protein [Flavobacterium sp.]PZO29771.1 MAG: lipid A biosynthesis acyltransferase [Flavobacteriaceae bacterium]